MSALRTPAPTARRAASSAGFTLAEVMVASAIFLFIALAAFALFNDGNRVYKQGNSAAEMQQRTRLAFEIMLDELRLAGYDFNRDGDENGYPEHPDEQIEFVGEHAFTFRGNLDFGDGTTGRETALELDPADPDFGTLCCPIVTTGNDEIVTYALRSDDASKNLGTIRFRVDTSAPRDGGWDEDGDLVGEEDVVIEDVDLTVDNPPYTLMRFSLADDGTVVEQPVASDIRSLRFSYESATGEDFWCSSPAADGTCAGGDQVPFTDLGGDDDLVAGDGKGRSGRAALRRINVELVGMTDHDHMNYADASDTRMPGRRKLVLASTVVPQNLGLTGRPDLQDEETWAPTNVTACVGHCNTIRIEWDDVPRAASYFVKLYTTSQTSEPFFIGSTPGIQVLDSDPPRVFAVYSRPDAGVLVNGARIFAKVQSRASGEETSEDSLPSATVELVDVARLESPQDVKATGYDPLATDWPDLSMGLAPDTLGASTHGAQVNQILVSWKAPAWAMQVRDPGAPGTTATAQLSSYPAVDCDWEWVDSDGDGTTDLKRSRVRDHFGAVRYLVFRSTNPRFVPTAADFVGAIAGEVSVEAGRVSYLDQTTHLFTNGVFNSTQNAIENCKTYYYRIRAADDCWAGSDPASTTDLHLSPFAPALNPDPSVDDTDDVSALGPESIGLAIPGFAIPQAPPRAPKSLRFANYDRRTDDGDGLDATLHFDAVKLDDFVDPVTTLPAYDHVTIARYEVWSSLDKDFTIGDVVNGTNGVQLDKTIDIKDLRAGRIAYDDENGDGTISTSEDESVPPTTSPSLPLSGLRIPLATTARYYKVVAVQCAAETTYPEDDAAAFDYGRLSDWVKFPCELGGGPFTVLTINPSNFPTSVSSDAFFEDVNLAARKARLILKDVASGDTVMSSPGVTPSSIGLGGYRATFNAAHIAALTDNFGNGNYRIAVEWEDANDCLGATDSANQSTSLPACCLSAATPTWTRVTTTRGRGQITETCGAASLRINRVIIEIDNANGGQPERFSAIRWNGTQIWTGNDRAVTIDRSTDPLILSAFTSGTLEYDTNRNLTNDHVTVTYEYRVGGQSGSCTFTGIL